MTHAGTCMRPARFSAVKPLTTPNDAGRSRAAGVRRHLRLGSGRCATDDRDSRRARRKSRRCRSLRRERTSHLPRSQRDDASPPRGRRRDAAVPPEPTSAIRRAITAAAAARKNAVEEARSNVARLLGCDADEIVFTSGGTESNNLAIRGVAAGRHEPRQIVTSVIEHPPPRCRVATSRPQGWHVDWIPVDREARVRLDVARRAR